MWELEPNGHLTILTLATDEADWANDDKIIRVLIQTHRGANLNFNILIPGCLPVLSGNSKEDVVKFAKELVLLFR